MVWYSSCISNSLKLFPNVFFSFSFVWELLFGKVFHTHFFYTFLWRKGENKMKNSCLFSLSSISIRHMSREALHCAELYCHKITNELLSLRGAENLEPLYIAMTVYMVVIYKTNWPFVMSLPHLFHPFMFPFLHLLKSTFISRLLGSQSSHFDNAYLTLMDICIYYTHFDCATDFDCIW